ncbi:MAG TPA: proline--tRNA ligase [Chloroflexota bacterium]|jgi:prolyl-tRNA synthetase|nr:proline--tRNA ligase [Chloroflexota bacterium]
MAEQPQASPSTDGPITPRSQDYPQWYQDIIAAAELIDQAPVRGCWILRPNGYAIWELIQRDLDRRFKEHGVQNAYFPMLIPMSYIEKEKEHVEGFSPELAVVTHGGGELLEEPLVVRPTSETIIWASFKRWVRSHRDLPMLVNQWCSVLRWEKRPRAFLRTAEFLWQEGHTAHASAEESRTFALAMLDVYFRVQEEILCLAPLAGEKPEHERFPGAESTFTLEPMMQDGRALQGCTSHDFGTTLSRAFEVSYQGEDGESHLAHATSWGFSTRVIGAVLMSHGDDRGAIFPPAIAPIQVAIVPVPGRDEASTQAVDDAAALALRELSLAGYRVTVDARPGLRPGAKFFHWERRGVPLRLEIGPRDVAAGQATAATRHDGQKRPIPLSALQAHVEDLLDEMQVALAARARSFRESRTKVVEDKAGLEAAVTDGYAAARWCEARACADDIQTQTRATIRCFPFERQDGAFTPAPDDPGPCAWCGAPARRRVVVARSY